MQLHDVVGADNFILQIIVFLYIDNEILYMVYLILKKSTNKYLFPGKFNPINKHVHFEWLWYVLRFDYEMTLTSS